MIQHKFLFIYYKFFKFIYSPGYFSYSRYVCLQYKNINISHIIHISICIYYIYIFFVLHREIICCGSIFRGANGEIIMYPSNLKPCINLARRQLITSLTVASPIHSSASTSPVHGVESPSSSPETSSKQTKTDSDSSSDSGYDESSNQGESKIAKNVQVQADVKMIEEVVRPIELDQLSSCKTLQSVNNIINHSLQSVSN